MKFNKKFVLKCVTVVAVVVTLLGLSLQLVSGNMKLSAKEVSNSGGGLENFSTSSESSSSPLPETLTSDVSKTESTEQLTSSETTPTVAENNVPAQRNLTENGLVEVGDWEGFAAALGDASVTTISLKNDIALSGTLNNVDGVFDKASVDSEAGFVYFFVEKAKSSRKVVIDGGGFTFDFGNVAIGFSNGSINTASYWDITLQNINVKSANYYAPFFYPVLAESKGITNAGYLTNSKLTYGDKYTHERAVSDYEQLTTAVATISVTNIKFINDIVTPLGNVDISRKVANIRNAAEKFSAYGATTGNTSGGTTFIYFNAIGIAREKIIDGDGYTWDQGSITWCYYNPTMTDTDQAWSFTLRNMNTYHGNYWGMIEFWDLSNANHSKTQVTYEDFTNHGTQLIESQYATVNFAGNIHIEQVASYDSVKKNGDPIRSFRVNYTNNQTISVSSASIKANSKVYMSALSGVPVHLRESGNFEIGKNAQVELVRNGPGDPENNSQGYSSVIDISSGSLYIREGAKVNAISHHTLRPTVLYMENSNSNLVVDKGAELTLSIDKYTGANNGSTYNPVFMAGGKVLVNGTLNILGNDMGASATHMFYAQGAVDFRIGTEGSMDIKSDSTNAAQTLMYLNNAGSTFKFSDAKHVNLEKTSSIDSTGGLIYMANGGILDVSVQNIYQWEAGNTAGGVTSEEGGYTYAYEPMSNMKLTYNGMILRSKTGSSMYTETKDRFTKSFTSQGQQRLLFEYVPAPSVGIKSINNDNVLDPGSITIFGYARPGTFVRLWEEAKNGTTSALVKGTEDKIATPITDADFDINAIDGDGNKMYVDDPTKPYTLKADANGDWSYTIASKDVKHFTANNVINAFGFNNLRSELATQIVLDKTAPTGTAVKYYAVKDDAVPDASVFVKDAVDTNPIPDQAKVMYAYNQGTDMATLMATASSEAAPHKVKVDISDSALDPVTGEPAPNTRTIEADLIVLDKPVTIDLKATEVTVEYKDIREMTDAELSNWVIKKSGATGYKIDRGGVIDLSNQIVVSDLGGLNNIESIVTADGNIVVSLTIPSSASGYDDYTTTIKVKVINLLSTLKVQFVNENDEPMDGYTLTITEKNGEKLVVSDEVDLTDSQYGVTQKLADIEKAGFEIIQRPAKETALYLDNTSVTATYKVTGLVYLASAPATINFGAISYDAKVKRVDDGTYEGDLVVNDTRATKSKWLLGAKLQSQMTNSADKSITLVDSLQYINGDDTIILNDGYQPIYQENDSKETSMKVTNISDTWGKTKESNGIKLVVDPEKAKVLKGTYTGVIEWQFMEATP